MAEFLTTTGIDDVSVFSRALGASEVASLYDAGRAQPQQPTQLATLDANSVTTVCTNSPTGAGTVDSLTPTLKATIADSDTTVSTHADFEMWSATDPTQPQPIVLEGTKSTTPTGSGPNVTTTTPTLVNGQKPTAGKSAQSPKTAPAHQCSACRATSRQARAPWPR